MRVVIVGAGLSGLTTAAMLRRLNIDCTVLEANPQIHSHYQSPVTLWCNALSCFRAFGLDQFIDATQGAAPEEFCGIRRASDGAWLLRIPNVEVSLRPMDTEEIIPSSTAPKSTDFSLVSRFRDDAFKLQLATVPLRATYSMKYVKNSLKHHCIDIRFGKQVVDLIPVSDRDSRGGVNVVCADGDVLQADIVVGADGMHSTIRKLVYPDEVISRSTTSLNMTQVDGYVNMDAPPARFGDSPCEIWGKRKVLNYYPLFHEGQKRVAFTATLFDNPKDITLNFQDMTLGEVRQMYRGVLSREFQEFGADVTEMFKAATVAVPVEALDVPLMPQWHNRRAVLIGDAAHGTFPCFLAQDASLCVEDASMVATAIAEIYELESGIIQHQFTNFERSRRARVERYIRQSRRARSFTMMSMDGVRDNVLRATPWWFATLGQQWLNDWSYRRNQLIYEPEADANREVK